jgi:phenylalanyl-tRNA synthetase alpha chain
MLERLETMRTEGLQEIASATTLAQLQEVRQKWMGKKGQLTEVLKELGKLSPEERKTVGRLANELKTALSEALDARQETILEEASSFAGEIDLTRPGVPVTGGALHPITQMAYDLNDAFKSLISKCIRKTRLPASCTLSTI